MLLSGQQSGRTVLAHAASRKRCISVIASHQNGDRQQQRVDAGVNRRAFNAAIISAAALTLLPAQDAHAGFKKDLKKRKIPEEEYATLPSNGLRYYDLEEGSGSDIKPGDKIVVHYDCLYRGLDVVSSRSARLLGGNRTIAEPYEFVVGEPVNATSLKPYDSDSANPLFSGSSGPKPPQALSLSVVGMKKGGKRSVIVDSLELGYPKGINELPAATTFELKVEVLSVTSKSA